MDVADFSGEARTPPLRMGRHYRSVEFQQLDLEAGIGLVAVVAEVAGGNCPLLHAGEAVDVSRDAQARSRVDLNLMMNRSLLQELSSSVT